ncbi:MAG TPA: nitronate monooxygenase [Alphaproteobacteria bacterium]|nr:nitronate monooxygenase [Alphaproteobacteria bacterium]
MARDPLRTRLCDMLEVPLPIVCFTHCREVAVAAGRAGAFPVLGEALRSMDEIERDVRFIRDRIGPRFGVDLVLPARSPRSADPEDLYAEIPAAQRAFADHVKQKYRVPEPVGDVVLRKWGGNNQKIARAQIEVVLDEKVPVIATGLGAPDFLFEEARARGVRLIALVGATRQAVRQIERGADMIVAQGYDAAGHTGGMGTFSIVPEVVSVAGDVPVIAAGGVTTGRHLAAALCLGAAGVWAGTVWLASDESDVDPIVKARILAATGADTTRTAALSGKTMRVLECPWTEEWESPDAPPVLPSPYQMLLTARYLQGANDARRADLMTEAVGQGVGFVTRAQPVAGIVEQMAAEARRTLAAFG